MSLFGGLLIMGALVSGGITLGVTMICAAKAGAGEWDDKR
jgi:hypothetical protein